MPLLIVSPPFPLPKAALPAQPLLLDASCLRFRTNQRRITSAVSFTEGVPTSDQGNSLFIIHRHASKSLSDIMPRSGRDRFSIRSFRVHVDQTHLHSREGFSRSRSPE